MADPGFAEVTDSSYQAHAYTNQTAVTLCTPNINAGTQGKAVHSEVACLCESLHCCMQ